MKRFHTTMISAVVLAGSMLTTPAKAESSFTPYIGLAAELHSGVDPRDYEQIAGEFTDRRDGSGAAGVYAGVRRGRLGLEAGWMFKKTTRWSKTETDAMGVETLYNAEVEAGGPYANVSYDVLAVSDARFYLKGGIAQGNHWETRLDGRRTASGGSSAIATTGAGARLELPESGLELRAEVVLRHDSDIGTKTTVRTGFSYRF